MEGIVVGADASAAGAAALDWALQEGVLRRLPVTVVRAWSEHVGVPHARGAHADPDGLRAAALQQAQELLDRARSRVPGAAASEVRVLAQHGRAAHVLTDASDGADLVVVGPRGHGALSRGVLGSVSAAVLHHAHCPVAVVPEPHDTSPVAGRVLVGVDHSPSSLRALAWAAEAAACRSAVLVPVAVREPAWSGPSGPGERVDLATAEAAERSALRAAVPRSLPLVGVEPEVLAGHAAHALLELSRPQDLLVLGSRGRGGFAGLLLGSTSNAVAQHARGPVVVVRGGPGSA